MVECLHRFVLMITYVDGQQKARCFGDALVILLSGRRVLGRRAGLSTAKLAFGVHATTAR